ncbi:SigE family RNA polymerase sigma factor [Actinoplanes sp. RD1]|uniref:SigE family RNA polymerase sigma factor n=1 Tax=Actinoplanes sp. RD1 TaxID=3064538 RepID=UPI0027407410|nr:SigE family RNA polymerase sigma factor [Actinoplanes sp. RD1]
MTETVPPRVAGDPRPGRGRRRRARDEEFTAFVEATATRLRRSAYLMCRDWHTAQDLTQQTYTKMYASWDRIRTSAGLEGYSRRVLMNLVFDQQKRLKGSELVLADLPDDAGPPPSSPELRLALVDALAHLSVEDRAVLVLRHAEDHSVGTVAAILGISVSSVKMRNARALARLRTLLGEDFLDAE